MSQVLIFDVDGTLTGPRRVMPEDFSRFFLSVAKTNPVYLVSGSDYDKICEQIPEWLLNEVAGIYCCGGNELWRQGQLVRQKQTVFPERLIEFVERLVAESNFWVRTGNHVEMRTGSLNISVVGRNANRAERAAYEEYDKEHDERQKLMRKIEAAFPEFEVNCGGQISIDVSPRGWNKAQIHPEIQRAHPDVPIHFFGDNIREGGNDLPLSRAVMHGSKKNRIHAVGDHFDTWKILQGMYCRTTSNVA